MHQAYFERKMSQPSTSSNSRSLTPKPFTRLQEDPTKSPERISTEYSQFAHHSPTVSSQKNLTANISFVPSKMSTKNREQILNTERLRNRSQQTQYYNPKNLHNVTTDLMRGKNPSRGNYIMTKTEPSVDLETSYASQVNKLLQKINKLKFDLGQSQERENQYLSKLSNLEKENKSLQMVIEERDKRILDITQKSKEDKLRMYQFLTELETHKQNNAEQCRGDDVSTLRLSELCDSSRKGEKGFGLEKGTQTVEGSGSSYECARCESVTSYCDHLINKLNEVDQASKIILKEYNSMKESMVKAKRAETDFVRARNEIEKRALEIQSDYDKQAVFYNEVMAENSTVRNTLKEAIDSNMVSFQSSSDQKKLIQNKNNERSQKKILPIPASLRALVGAERILKAAAN